MANYSTLKAAVNQYIKQNGNKDITGPVLNSVLTAMIDSLGANYTFAGIATPSTNPGTPDQNVFYFAMQGGTYTNFNATALPEGISLLLWNGSWTAQTIMYDDGGVFDISVYKSTGGTLATFADLSAALGTGGANIPEAARKGGMSIKFVQSSDNKYVQYRLIAQSFTTDTTQWAIADEGVYVENPEFIYIKTDAEDKILWAIKKDGSIYYGAGVPQQVIDYIEEKIAELSLDEYEDIVAFLTDYLGSDTTLKALIDDINERIPTLVENLEWLSVTTDAEGKVINGIRKNNGHCICGGIDVNELAEEVHNFDPSSINDATPTTHGLMSAADKTKLDGLTANIATTESKGYLSPADKYKIDNVENIYHSYNNATPSTAGLMSAADKTKLDNMIVQAPTISGSGMYKNAAAYGFLPSNDGATNADNLQDACDGGGTIVIDIPGVYEIKHKILLDSNTTLIFGANVFIKRVSPATPAEGQRWDYYSFINRGAYTKEWNEYITIIGLHFLPNGVTFDAVPLVKMSSLEIAGVNGHICFFYVKHLKLIDLDVYDIPSNNSTFFAVHIQRFEDVLIENVNINYAKDGLHFGAGEGLTIRHGRFRTNDDSIALNACDYPNSNADSGWIKDIVIEDIVFVEGTAEEGWPQKQRFVLFDTGAWLDWSSGMTVAKHGAIVVSNGRIYRTIGNPFDGTQITYMTSTVQPTHLSGFETTSDGITWYMAQDRNIVYNAGIENLVIRDVISNRVSSFLFYNLLDISPYTYQYHVGSDVMLLKNISIENVRGNYLKLISLEAAFRNFRILKSHIKNNIICNNAYNISDDKKSTLFISNCTFDEYTNYTLVTTQGTRVIKVFCTNNFFLIDKTPSNIRISGENIELIAY